MTRELASIITAAAALVDWLWGLILPSAPPSLPHNPVLRQRTPPCRPPCRPHCYCSPCFRGADVSVEGLHKGYTHVFITTFDDAKGRDAYVEDPAHKEYAGVLFQGLEDGIVLDYVPSVALSRFFS
ncbi:unnamed protein product [Closterium sp. Naga37s-1]|nr:unnamed protein product [Closterium sp. Naga37s-1]